MAAHVADEVGSDAPLHEAPLPFAALEAVVVATADDWFAKPGRAALAVR
jgi:hypothetical protein